MRILDKQDELITGIVQSLGVHNHRSMLLEAVRVCLSRCTVGTIARTIRDSQRAGTVKIPIYRNRAGMNNPLAW